MSYQKIKAYYRLTKPGVLYGNVLTTVAGFLFASQGNINSALFMAAIIGTSLVIASACVINNYLDQDIDSKMERTKSRPLIAGEVSGRGAVIFSIILGVLGVFILYTWVNLLVTVVGVLGFIVYVVFYGMLSKRMSIHGTLVGSVSGAAPIIAGYLAVTGSVDVTALILFAILFLWQMPEFYSISIFRQKEYKKAKVPVISVVKGIDHTKKQIFAYIVLFSLAVLCLYIVGSTGYVYLTVVSGLCIYWLWLSYKSIASKQDITWSRKIFKHSLVVLLVFSLLISVDHWLP